MSTVLSDNVTVDKDTSDGDWNDHEFRRAPHAE